MNLARLEEEVRRLVPIEALVRETVYLTPSRREMRGACPSHPDVQRALHVDQRAGLYLCYACRRQGDVIRWTMEAEGLSKEAALLALSRRAGITGSH